MAGIYLHIPFCKQACHYCNFHFSTTGSHRNDLLRAMQREIMLRKHELEDQVVESVYFGGGTPSLLTIAELAAFMDLIREHFQLAYDAEVTLEANPDDLDRVKASGLLELGINRLSLGIQSFRDQDLQYMHRAHDARQARAVLEIVARAGFSRITADLIYGFPGLSDAAWLQNLEIIFDYNVPHLSSYALTVEPRTALEHKIRTGQLPPISEDQAAHQFTMLMQETEARGYHHYEISNFALPGQEAVHNTNYWRGVPYLGIGPSAHSYDGRSRSWNIAHNVKYLKALEADMLPRTIETLTPVDRYNEYVMTSLRTSQGCALAEVTRMGPGFRDVFLQGIAAPLREGWLEDHAGHFRLTRAGKLMADRIASDLFMVNEGE